MGEPLSAEELAGLISDKLWLTYRSDEDPKTVPSAFRVVVYETILQAYENVDRMLGKVVRDRLEKLYLELESNEQ